MKKVKEKMKNEEMSKMERRYNIRDQGKSIYEDTCMKRYSETNCSKMSLSNVSII